MKNYALINYGTRNMLTGKMQTMPKFSIEQLIYVDHPPLITWSTDTKTDKYNYLIPGWYGPFNILHVTWHTLTVNANGISNTISIDRATAVAWTVNHPRHISRSRLLFKEEKAAKETKLLPQLVRDLIPPPLQILMSTPLAAEKTFLEKKSNLETSLLSRLFKNIITSRKYQLDSYTEISSA